MSSSTKEEAKAEAIMICLDNSFWMESIKSPMFQEQLSGVSLYIEKKISANLLTEVAIFGMSDPFRFTLHPTRDHKGIMRVLKNGIMPIGGPLRVCDVAELAPLRFMKYFPPDNQQKRIVLFAAGPLHVLNTLEDATMAGKLLKEYKVACDVIHFGIPYKDKRRDFFNTLIFYANDDGNCNVCHVPPESSIRAALSRSQIFIPRQSRSAQSSYLQYENNKAMDICVSSLQYDKNKAVDIYVKSPSDGADLKTDCPFCQTVLLTLEEKGVSYNTHFIDLRKKPKGIFKQNQETLPLIMFHDGTRVSNSDVLVEMIDKMYPGRSLVTPPDFAYLGVKILPKIVAFLKTRDEDDREALVYDLQKLENHLSQHGFDYVNEKEITAVDLSLAPKLYHLVNACSCNEDNWNVLQDLPYVQTYTKRLFKSDSFTRTKPCPQNVLEGWHKRLARK